MLVRSCMALAVVAMTASASFSQCPSYTHKDDVVLGTTANLPDGWVVYGKNGVNGLFKSSLRTFSETTVSGTSTDRPTMIDITPDGEWVVYINSNDDGIYVVKSSGGSRTRVPAIYWNNPHLTFFFTGFRRNAPGGGLEIFWLDFSWEATGGSFVGAIPVSFASGTPVFGTAKKLADTKPYFAWPYQGAMHVYGDQIFSIFRYPAGKLANAFLTIPSNGTGVAGPTNFYAFSSEPSQDYWGCGHSISHDGQYCVSNSALIGSACVPNQKNDPVMDHKGFYVTKFLRQGTDPAITIDAQIDNPLYGRSINWCPTEYRQGDNTEVDFTEWNFSNDNQYMAGVVKGSAIASLGLSKGIWIVRWLNANTWTKLTPNTTTTEYVEPAMFINGVGVNRAPASPAGSMRVAGSRVINGGSITFESGMRGAMVFDMSGRAVWSCVNPSGHSKQFSLPGNLRGKSLLVQFE